MGIIVTKEASKLILMSMIEEDLDTSEYALYVGLDKSGAMSLSFEKGLYNVSNFHGLNVVANDMFQELVVDAHEVNGRVGLVFKGA